MNDKKWDIKQDNKKDMWKIGLLILICLQVLVVLYYGSRKMGFHEDEYYSYYSTNRTAGLFVPDREWVEKETYFNEFVVLNGEQFNYKMVATVQSWDVHPPFFYFILHTVCSFFPGIFSKWLGISVNLIAYVINFFLLAWLTYMITNKNKVVTLLVSAVYGFNAVIISGVLFIRMYEWLTLFVLLCACLHVRAMKKGELRFHKFLLPLMLVNYFGFLTQYYYLIFLFFIAVGFGVWLLFCKKRILYLFQYGLICAFSLGLAIITYPSSVSHIFRGYRGTGAATEFFDAANTGDRLQFFLELLDDYLFAGTLWMLLLFLCIMTAALLLRKKRNAAEDQIIIRGDYKAYFLLLFAACGYFFTVSKTALLLYETSNRYQLPVYSILLMLMVIAVYSVCSRMFHALFVNGTVRKTGIFLIFIVFLAGDFHGHLTDKVLFLYEKDQERVEYARENAHVPVIILYNEATPYHVWWCSEELMQYDGAYFASEGNEDTIADESISKSRKLIVYAADHERKEESLQMVLDSNPYLKDYQLISQKSLWSVYEFK